MNTIIKKTEYILNKKQHELSIGTLLGDGNLQTSTLGKTWRFRAIHKKKDKDYLLHKYKILSALCETAPLYSEVFDKRTQKYYKRWSFNTLVHTCLNLYGKLFYFYNPKTKLMEKDVPLNINRYLTPWAIAYWYMDDGSLKWAGKSNAMRICTESFSEHGVLRSKAALYDLYKIETQMIRKTTDCVFIGNRLARNEKNATAFRILIKPFLLKTMRYKVSDGLKGRLT